MAELTEKDRKGKWKKTPLDEKKQPKKNRAMNPDQKPDQKRLTWRNRRKQKREQAEKEHYRITGILVSEQPVLVDAGKRWFFLTNALITFLLVMGSAGVYLKAFRLHCYYPVLMLYAMALSLFAAYLYSHFVLRILGYLASFAGFIWVFFYERYRIRGGFAYIFNRLMKIIENKLSLPVEQSYNVYGYSEKSSVTVCVMFLFIISILLVNAAVTESKGFEWVFIMTFPATQVGFYFDLKVHLFYYVMYLSGLISIYFLRSSSHCRMESRKRKGYTRRKRKNKVIYNYVNDGKHTMSFTLLVILFVMAVTLLAGLVYPQRKYVVNSHFDAMKTGTKESIRKAAMVGFFGMINPGGSAGGVDRNKMGDARYVRLDYETDLLVKTAVEQGENSLYLSAFYGSFYGDAYWKTINEYRASSEEKLPSLQDAGLTPAQILRLPHELNQKVYGGVLLGKEKAVEVTNRDATPDYHYLPYDLTDSAAGFWMSLSSAVSVEEVDGAMTIRPEMSSVPFSDDEMNLLPGGLQHEASETLSYAPLRSWDSISDRIAWVKEKYLEVYEQAEKQDDRELLQLLETEKKYREYVYRIYRTVPEKNESVIKTFCETYGLKKDDPNLAERVAQIFNEDYEYTLIPGKTPAKKEFVNYFLEESRKGYCTYFATAATLVFRYLGIPARFVGGYVLLSADFRAGTKVSDSELSNNSALKQIPKDTAIYPFGVYEYELTDREAHAWVEIYLDGFGWIPVEVTPYATGNEEMSSSGQENSLSEYITGNLFSAENMDRIKRASLNALETLLLGMMIVFFLYEIFGIFLRFRRKHSKSCEALYRYLTRCLGFAGVRRPPSMSYEEYGSRILEAEWMTGEEIMNLTRILEKEKFSGESVSGEELETMSRLVFKTSAKIHEKLSVPRKFVYRFILLL